jgi:hypothetical protein
VDGIEALGAGAIVGEVRTDATVAQEDVWLQDVVAGDRRTFAITASDIATLPGRTHLLGVATDTTERDVDRPALDGETRRARREERSTFFGGSPPERAKLSLRAEEQGPEGQSDRQKDASDEEFGILHGGGN